ncbi:MAG: hypothetical protein HC898_11040 [Phycisphaerales bacterium]|nr:hypothetical protein [Phycisphaerales bacterium]
MLRQPFLFACYVALSVTTTAMGNTIVYENTFDAPDQIDIDSSGFNAGGFSGSQNNNLIINQLFTTSGGVGGSNARVTEIVTVNEPGFWWVGTQGYFEDMNLTTSDASQLVLTVDIKASSARQFA